MPTLVQPPIGNTAWGADMNNNLQVLQNQLTSAMQGRVAWVSTTQIALQRYLGDTVEVNGLNVSMGASGLALNTSDNLISSTGADAGAAMAASTLYYLYVSNANASPFPSSVRASTTTPSALNGVKYLGTTGNAANWRFVGYVRTDGSTTFQDSLTQRFVVNYYNRRATPLFSSPKYADDNAINSYSTGSTTYTPANGGVGSKIELISNGEDAVLYGVTFGSSNSNINQVNFAAVGVDSTTSADIIACKQVHANGANADDSASRSQILSEGYRHLNLLICVSGGTGTYAADDSRRGSSSDPYRTFIMASVMA